MVSIKAAQRAQRNERAIEAPPAKSWPDAAVRVVLVYPNTYHVGMSNLGLHAVYRLLNQMAHVLCERAFLPDTTAAGTRAPLASIESERPLTDFDIVAFSVAFENDYPNLLWLLEKAGIPLRSTHRAPPLPLVVAGGVASFLNPEPLAPFIDCFFMGEAEALLPRFFDRFDPLANRTATLHALARELPGIYVPAFYKPVYAADGALRDFQPLRDVPPKIKRVYLEDLSGVPACSAILTEDTIFDRTFLIEVARGCPHGCRFCSAGFIYRPPRFRPLPVLQKCMQSAAPLTDRIGLVGTAVSDLPQIDLLCRQALDDNIRLSFSSLRADALDETLTAALAQSGVKTATIAPDAGSERLRRVINKGITEADIFSAAEMLVTRGIPNLKLYFMVGLPTETPADVEAIVKLCRQIKHRFLKASRPRKHLGTITVSLNSFVPKPFTPFQWVAMDPPAELKSKIKTIKSGLRSVANVRVHASVPKWDYVQGLLSRGDRQVGTILAQAHHHAGNWPRTFKESPLNPDYYVLRERSREELFPWDFIEQGVSKSFLWRELRRARLGKTSPPCRVKDCHLCGVCRQ
jgi:radical SAM superfamily enzyme YgiQ (UPF0313 family)